VSGQAAEAPFITCENLVKIFRVGDAEVLALQGLDMQIALGELMAIVGSSGSGKSTLMNILGGLDLPTAGRIVVDGHNLLKLSPAQLNDYRRSRVGFVWQQKSRNLIPYLTATENVELPMVLAGAAAADTRAWARDLLGLVGLQGRARHRPPQLSGGEQQRVAIAVALANRPRLLLADEPTGELDTATARAVLGVFRQLNQTLGITTVIVSHDREIGRHVDRVVAIRDGKTSTERVRRAVASSAPDAAPAAEAAQTQPAAAAEGEYHEYVVLDSAGRLQIPADYREKLDIGDRVTLDVMPDGLLIKPVAGRGLVQKDEPGESAQHGERRPARRGLFARWRHRR
jgi:putative ABC transport system ATP-binding protein